MFFLVPSHMRIFYSGKPQMLREIMEHGQDNWRGKGGRCKLRPRVMAASWAPSGPIEHFLGLSLPGFQDRRCAPRGGLLSGIFIGPVDP